MKNVTRCMLMMFPACLAASAKTDKPNIVFVLVDDFRYDAIVCCGNQVVNTPSIDHLAAQGLYFRNAFSSSPISSASRASILTRLYERTHRYSFQTGPLEQRSALRNKTDELTHRYSANGWVAPTNIFSTFVGNSKDNAVKHEKQYFGWELPSISKAQKAFQLLVADNKSDIERHVGNMWNSGYVNSGNSVKVEYKGKELKKGQKYYWYVRTWDYLNRTSQYSSVQDFVYGKNEMRYADDKLVDPAKLMQWGLSLTMKSNRLSQRMAPDMSNITRSDICYPIAIGELQAHYRGKGKTGQYEINVPANVAADFILPEDVTGEVLLNDVPQTLNYGSLQLQPGKSLIQIQNNTF